MFLFHLKKTNEPAIRHRDLLEKITHRGPKAYVTFLSILETTFPVAFEALQKERIAANQENLNCITQTDLFTSCWPFAFPRRQVEDDDTYAESTIGDENTELINGMDIELTQYEELLPEVPFTVTKSTEINYSKVTSTYRMESRNRGVAFIVNIIDFPNYARRAGADVDRNFLVTLFREMGFTVFYFENFTKSVRTIINILNSCFNRY